MSDNVKKIKKVFKLLTQFSKYKNKLEKALEKLEWPIEIFFISLTNEIILELEKINTDNQTPKTHKRMSSNISNNSIYLEKTGKLYLYQMINVFDEIKDYKKKFTNDIIEYIITPENIQKILHILMATNKITTTNLSMLKEMNEFNSYIMNLLINIINLNNKILIDVLSSESQYNVFYQLFILFSKNEENRSLLYELERNIFWYYPDNINLKEIINYTIDCIDEELNKDNCKKLIQETKTILYLYKKDIDIISKMMTKLIIKIFTLFENELEDNYFINDFLKFCFNEICFDGNNKFYDRFIFKNTNKSRTVNIRGSNLTLEKPLESRNTEINNNNEKNDIINESLNININRGNTVNPNDNENKINENIYNKNKIKNYSVEDFERNNLINIEKGRIYNPQFMNYLLDIYNTLISLNLKNSYSIVFIELFLSINNSNEGKSEYSFLIKNTNYKDIILPSLLKLKDESLIAVYFSKIIFLSIPSNDKNNCKNSENDCYVPEVDLNFFFNNIYTFMDEDEKIFSVISSQIINLVKMNKNIIDIILNKFNIYAIFLSIINNDKYNNEIKRRITEFLEKILEINNNKFKYELNIPIVSYKITDNNLLKKIYSLSLIYENNITELTNKIILIIDYMNSLFKEVKIEELIIFLEILLEGIYRNILNSSNYKIFDDETINKLNNIIYELAMIKINDSKFNYKEIFFILLKFVYNYNKKYIINYLNEMPTDNKNKLIIEENTIYMIVNNFFVNEKDFKEKTNFLNYLFFFCLDIYEKTDIPNINNKESNENYNYLLKAPNILVNIINILCKIKDYQCLGFIIDKIIYLTNYSQLNIKILLTHNNFIQIILKLIIDISHKKEEEQLYIKLNMLLNDLSKYLPESPLIQYLNEIYFIFYKTIAPYPSLVKNEGEGENNKDIILELFNILKYAINNSKNNNYEYLSLSNCCFYNPYVYNLFFIKELKFEEEINIFLCLDIDIRISTYTNIGVFHLIDFINEMNDVMLSFSITNEKQLIITEKSLNNNKNDNIFEVKNINEVIPDDGYFHRISIIINSKLKKIIFVVDEEKIQSIEEKNTISFKYNLFDFYEFDIFIGYKSENIKLNTKNNKLLSNISIIDIRNILITKFNNFDEYNYVYNKKKEIYKNDILLDNNYKNKNYFDKIVKRPLENRIIADINFKNKNIKIIKSSKMKNEIKSFKDFLSNEIINNKFISYYSTYFPANINTVNNYCTKVYMLSLNNNIEEFYALNNPNNIVIYNINHKYIQSKIFDNYNASYSGCNYFFIDYLLSFFFDIEKRRNEINKNNNSKDNEIEEKKDNINEINDNNKDIQKETILLSDNFLNDCILIILEIILELPSEEIIDYFLFKNNNISIKLRTFFYRNVYLFNENNEFIQKFFQIIQMEQKNSKLEEENKNKNNEVFLLVFMTEIFLDLLLFKKLNFNNQNYILIILLQLLMNINFRKLDNMNNILFKLLKQIYNIVLYYQLSSEEINYNIGEEKNPTQIYVITKCVDAIFYLFEISNNKEYIKKIIDINLYVINFYSNYLLNITDFAIKSFEEKYKSYITYSFLANDNIHLQIEKLVNSISRFKQNKVNKEENNETNKLELNDSNKENNGYFYSYVCDYFKLNFDNIYNNIKYDKLMDNNYINMFLNLESYRKILGVKNFGWFLSRNESNHKIQNKFFLKKNDIKQKKSINKKIYKEVFTYEYIYDKEKYKSIFKYLYELFLYENISNDFHLINSIYKTNENKNKIIENCLYIKAIHKTLSIIIILNEYILILTNICVDSSQKLHVVQNEIDATIWCVQKEEYESQLEQYIANNEKNILKEVFTNVENKKGKKSKGFGYNNSYKFSYKKIYYKNITEMHRVSYLTIPNSIEIFMTNGKSYFICLNISKREKIFTDIITKINDFYIKKDIKIEGYSDFYLKKSSKNINNENFYMRHCPIPYLENNSKEYSSSSNGLFGVKLSARKKTSSIHNSSHSFYYNNAGMKIKYSKSIVTVSSFLSDVYELWTKNKISNYDYIVLLNILSGRSLNNLSQYFIFPRLLNDFNHTILNWISSSIYRDLSYPVLASEPQIRDDIKTKYDLNAVDKYHSGTFYSTYAFVAYFTIRQRPFSEISLEIQGGEFDTTDRLFIGAKEICSMKEKYQESIPFLMTLPELYVNNNKFNFGKTQKYLSCVNDFELPKWSKDDPRKFTLVIKRIFESKNVNLKLNKWIDLIFGIAQSGPEAVKNLNTYRKACYELAPEEIEELNKKFELLGNLIEKRELGYTAKQIFKKPHKKKENINEYKENENMFFDTNLKLRKIKFEKINNTEYNKDKTDIVFNSINDFAIDIDNDYIKNTNIKNDCQGGIASLKSIIKAINDNSSSQKIYNPLKVRKAIEKVNNFIILGNGYYFLGKNYDYILCYNEKYLEIINYKLDLYYCYFINESNNISTLVANDKGSKLYIAFNNGNIIEYKVIFEDEELLNENKNINNIYPIIKSNTIDKLSVKFNEIYIYNLNEDSNNESNKSFVSLKRSQSKKSKKKKGCKPTSPPIISLQKNLENNFVFNNPHIPEKIIKIKLNEENKILIAISISNIIYLISLNNKFKLMHIVKYYNNYNFQYKIKDIIPLSLSGDFLIYSSMTVHLFSINGVPLCELNLLDKVHESLSKITCCWATFIYDVILFTGHEDASIVIWKVKNKNTMQNFNERVSYLYNNNKSKFFLNEYYYNYDYDTDDNNYNCNVKECELQRKFEIVSQIKMEEGINDLSISYMKMSQDMSYMIILDNKKDIYLLSNFIDYKEDNNSNNNIFGYFKDKKIYCVSCCKEIEDNYYRASRVQSLSNIQGDSLENSSTCEDTLFLIKNDDESNGSSNINSNNDKEENNKNNKENKDKDKDNKDNKEINYICEECKLKLINIESYLYNY